MPFTKSNDVTIVDVAERSRDIDCLTQLSVASSQNSNKSRSTIKSQPTGDCVLPHLVLGHALVTARVVLLKAGNLQHGVRVLHFDFAGEGNAVGPPPGDFWDGAVRHMRRKSSAGNQVQVSVTICSNKASDGLQYLFFSFC